MRVSSVHIFSKNLRLNLIQTFDLFKRLKMTAPDSEYFLYFAFGSNLSSDRIHISNKSAVFNAVGCLKNYRLEFCGNGKRWRGAAANIIPDTKSSVFGVLWKLKRSDLQYLDQQESVPLNLYERVPLQIEVVGEPGPVSCFGYQLTPASRHRSLLEGHLPSKVYKDVVIRGAKEHGLPQHYIEFLEKIQDNGYDGVVDLTLPE